MSRLYTLRKQVHDCKQGTVDVTSYFNKLSMTWQMIDFGREIIWDCPCEGVSYHKIEVVDRVYDFLAGSNLKFDEVRGSDIESVPNTITAGSVLRNSIGRRLIFND